MRKFGTNQNFAIPRLAFLVLGACSNPWSRVMVLCLTITPDFLYIYEYIFYANLNRERLGTSKFQFDREYTVMKLVAGYRLQICTWDIS